MERVKEGGGGGKGRKETNNGKSSRKTLEFGQERLKKYLDQYLNKDNLPLDGLQVEVVYKMSS